MTVLEDVIFTRVAIVSKIASVYDPIGLATPMMVNAKIKIRELSIRGLDWSDDVTGENRAWWESWLQSLSTLNSFASPRCLFPQDDNIVDSELHSFSDSSEEAFTAVFYLRHQYRDGRIKTRLVMVKSKLAPKKTISVAKLELNSPL